MARRVVLGHARRRGPLELVVLPLVVAERLRVAGRPAVVGRGAHDLVAARARRTARTRRRVGVRRVVGDVGDVVLVHLDAERVAEAHRVDLRARLGLRRAVHEREQVPGRDGVRAGAGAEVGLVGVAGGDVAVLDLDADQLAAQVVGVQRAAARVTGGPLVPAALLLHRDRGRRSGRARQGRAVDRQLRLVGLCLAAPEEHVQVRRVGRAAARLDLVRLDVRERFERRVDLGPRGVERQRSRGLAAEREGVGAARRFVRRTNCCSSVSWSFIGPWPPPLMPPAGLSSPVTSHRLLCLSKSMSPATWQHSWRLTGWRRICCSEPRSSRARWRPR